MPPCPGNHACCDRPEFDRTLFPCKEPYPVATFTLPVAAPDFDLAEWALVCRAWNAFRTPGEPRHDRISAGLGRTVAAYGLDRTPDAQPPPPSRWARLGDRVSPSGRVLFRCGGCGRDSATPDKSCPAGCGESS